MTRVLIADDDDLMRAGLVELLTADPTIEIIGQASTGRRGRRPSPPARTGRRADGRAHARPRRHRRHPRAVRGPPRTAKVLILTTFEQDDYIFGALRAGASGFLLKRTRPEELIAAVHTIAAGDSLLSPSVTRRVIDRMAQQPDPRLADQAKLDELTPREREVLELIARGLSNREIAAALVVEESTIRTHVKRILMKLDLRDRVQAVIFAYETGSTAGDRTGPTRQPAPCVTTLVRDGPVGHVVTSRPVLPGRGVLRRDASHTGCGGPARSGASIGPSQLRTLPPCVSRHPP